jgi:hypothetical protein
MGLETSYASPQSDFAVYKSDGGKRCTISNASTCTKSKYCKVHKPVTECDIYIFIFTIYIYIYIYISLYDVYCICTYHIDIYIYNCIYIYVYIL